VQDVIHFRLQATLGLFDIRREPGVSCGFLARESQRRPMAAGEIHEFESKFHVVRPLKGFFEVGQLVNLGIVAPAAVTRMVAVSNGRWVEMTSTPIGGSTSSSSVISTMASNAMNLAKARQNFEGSIRIQRFGDLTIFYKLKGQQFNLLYRHGGEEVLMAGLRGAGASSATALPAASAESASLVSSPSLPASDLEPPSPFSPAWMPNRHAQTVLDSRGTCFERRAQIVDLKFGKRSVSMNLDTKSGVGVKAEVRRGWEGGVKVADKITVVQTGSRGADEVVPTQGAANSSSTQSYDSLSWEITVPQFSSAGDYSIHLFLSSQGSGVYRFALVLYLRVGDKGGGFNLDA
jgi:hypothetical protein